MRHLLAFTLGISLLATPAVARKDRPVGVETIITFAGNGGLRDWQAGPANSDILYVRDRALRWYQVQLTGPYIKDRALDTLTYTTDANGTFDRFSQIMMRRYPNQVCGVRSVRTSLPPQGQPGAPKPNR